MEEQHHRQVLLEAQEGVNELNVHKLIQILQTRSEGDGKRDTTMRRLLNRTEEIEQQIQSLWSIRIIQGINKEMEDLMKTLNTGRLDGALKRRHRENEVERPMQPPLVISVAALAISLLHLLLRLVAGTVEWRVREETARSEEKEAR